MGKDEITAKMKIQEEYLFLIDKNNLNHFHLSNITCATQSSINQSTKMEEAKDHFLDFRTQGAVCLSKRTEGSLDLSTCMYIPMVTIP